MCGVYGWQLKADTPRDKVKTIAAVLAVRSCSRGRDSWGVYLPRRDRLIRGLGSASNGFRSYWNETEVIGHTRLATTGAVTVENAHPFRVGNIIGCHNGMLHNHAALNGRYGRKFEVDSQHIFAHIKKRLPKGDLHAYGTIVWYDQHKPGRVYFCKFGGPLAIHECKYGLVWASEEGFVKDALESANAPGEMEYHVKQDRIYFTEDGVLYDTKEDINITGGYNFNAWDWRSDLVDDGYEVGHGRYGALRHNGRHGKYQLTQCSVCGEQKYCSLEAGFMICIPCHAEEEKKLLRSGDDAKKADAHANESVGEVEEKEVVPTVNSTSNFSAVATVLKQCAICARYVMTELAVLGVGDICKACVQRFKPQSAVRKLGGTTSVDPAGKSHFEGDCTQECDSCPSFLSGEGCTCRG